MCLDDDNICNGPESCDSVQGCQSGPPAPDGTSCGNGGQCQAGMCSSDTIVVTPTRVTLAVGDAIEVVATGTPPPHIASGTLSYIWSSSDPAVATVSYVIGNNQVTHPNQAAIIGVMAGTTTVTVTYASESGRTPVTATVEVVVGVEMQMTAHRPQTPHFRQIQSVQREIPDNTEENPGVGIRVNGDDDDHDLFPDRADASVLGEDDLIEVTLGTFPENPPPGIEYILKRSSASIKVWGNSTKEITILDTINEKVLVLSSGTRTV
jgi:hypothetical protein